MEILNNIWLWALGILGGISFAGILTAVIYGLVKGFINRTLLKVNIERSAEIVADKMMGKIKNVTLTQDIKPILESDVKKISETMEDELCKAYQRVEQKYDKILSVFEKFCAYFDDSLISETKKEELKKAIKEAKENPIIIREASIAEIVIDKKEDTKETETPKVADKKPQIER